MRTLEELKNELARRVGPVLRDVPASEFEKLIEEMARLQHKYDLRQRERGD